MNRSGERIEDQLVLRRQPLRPVRRGREMEVEHLREAALIEPDNDCVADADDRYRLDVTFAEEGRR